MRAILRVLDLFNPLSVKTGRWNLLVKMVVTAALWYLIGLAIFVPQDSFNTTLTRLNARTLGFDETAYTLYQDGESYSVTISNDEGSAPSGLNYYFTEQSRPFLGTTPEGGFLGLLIGSLATGLIWYPATRSNKAPDESSRASSQKTKNEEANEALLTLLDVLSPDERQIIRDRLMDTVNDPDERIPVGIYEEETYSSRY